MDLTSLSTWVFFTSLLAWIIKHLIWRLTQRLPPGPWGLPLLGYKPFLSKKPYEDYIKMKEKYGNIIGLHLGMQYVLVLNDFTDIKELFNKDDFLDRPPDWFKFSDEFDNVLNMNGKDWKETRRFTMSTLRNLGMGKNKIEEVMKEEVSDLIQELSRTNPEAEVNISHTLLLHFWNIILSMTCGRTYEDRDKLQNIVEEYTTEFLERIIDNQRRVFYPFLRPYLWIKKVLNVKPALLGIKTFIRNEIERHRKAYDENNPEDFISFYLNEMKSKEGSDTAIKMENLMDNTEILMFAGTDTTRTTISWTLLYLAKYQQSQQKMYEEIVNYIGKERLPSFWDKDELPYTNAFIAEVARVKTIVPSEDPHWTSNGGTIGKYCIPKDTMIIANIEAVHKDRKLWGDPENFRPERFLSTDGRRVLIPDYWIPFLTGKRSCPGAKLANMEIFLFVTSLLQKFRLVAPKSGLSLESNYMLMDFPGKPFLSFKKREP